MINKRTYSLLLRRTKHLELLLHAKVSENHYIRERAHVLSMTIFRAGAEISKSVKQQNKTELLLASSKKQLQSALLIIIEKGQHIKELKKMVTEFRIIENAISHRIAALSIQERARLKSTGPHHRSIEKTISMIGKSSFFSRMA